MSSSENSSFSEKDKGHFDYFRTICNASCERSSFEIGFNKNDKHDSINGIPSFELKLKSKKYIKKYKEIKLVLVKKPFDLNKLRKLAVSEGGLLEDELRKIAWPKLLEITDVEVPNYNNIDFQNHPEYQQVVLDVNRSLKRFPPGIPFEQRLALQNQLIFLILRIMTAHPRLKYYQGFHDVAVTLLLVTGLDIAYGILEKLSTNHLKDCMEPTMEKTSHLLNFIYPLVRLQNKEVYEHLEKSGVGTMFALPWFLTWFGHNLNHYKDIVRLYDYFLANEPFSPLYLSSVIITFRAKDILNTPCDMASLHSLLSQIPDDLPFETLLAKTTELYVKYPPEKINKEALSRTYLEEKQREKEFSIRKYRRNHNLPFLWRIMGHIDPNRRLPVWAFIGPNRLAHNMRRYQYLVATATFAVGLYAIYLKAVEATFVT